ncbi:MAG: ATP-binding protein [Candidatus Izimaplasma sp.]|nr:ATP-binding protein [Candidatus Izimaplasma bacterium]
MDLFNKEYAIEKHDIANAGTIASLTKRELKKRGLTREFIKKVTIGIYEAEINVVMHSYGGEVTIRITDKFIEIIFTDRGPGIESIDEAMTAGFSTASSYAIENGFGAGMGLPNIKAVSDEMLLTSSKKGTRLYLKFYISSDNYES